MNWTGNRFKERYIYKRVSWQTWKEIGEYDFITDGSIEKSNNSDYKVSGSFSFEGTEAPDTHDLLRVYYQATDEEGETVTEPLATFFVEYASLDHSAIFDGVRPNGIKASGKFDGVSVMSVLKNKSYGRPYTIVKGTNAIYKAQLLVDECGLPVEYEPNSFCLAADHTFDASATYLDMVKWLCDVAGYTAMPNAMGTVELMPTYKSKRVLEFANGSKSIMYPQLTVENDWQKTCNVVKVLYNTDKACAYAAARNERGSKASLENRGGREITYTEEVSEVDTTSGIVQGLMELATAKLLKLSPDVEFTKFDHAYIPIDINDVVRINYSGEQWEGRADVISIKLEPSAKTTTKIKRVLADEIETTVEGAILRGEE